MTTHKYRDSLKVRDVRCNGHSVLSSFSLKTQQNPDIVAQNWFTYLHEPLNRQSTEAAWMFQAQPGFLCGCTLTLNLRRMANVKRTQVILLALGK